MDGPGFDYEKQIPAGFYDKIFNRKAGVRYCWHDLKFRSVAANLAHTKKLLDIGCGPGTFIGNYLGDIDALGIDLSAAQIGYANRHHSTGSHRFSAQSTTGLLEANERFDTITMIELVEHLAPEDADRLLAETRQLLIPDGLLIVTTPNYRSPWPATQRAVARFRRRALRSGLRRPRRYRPQDRRTRHGWARFDLRKRDLWRVAGLQGPLFRSCSKLLTDTAIPGRLPQSSGLYRSARAVWPAAQPAARPPR